MDDLSNCHGSGAEKQPSDVLLDMKERPQWVAFSVRDKGGKWLKTPINLHSGGGAASDDPDTWSTYKEVEKLAKSGTVVGSKRVTHAGYALNGDYTCIELDDCFDGNALAPWAQAILDRFSPTYSEKSVSDKGLHVWVKGTLPGRGHHPRLEGYAFGVFDRQRFIVMTFEAHTPDPIADRQGVLNEWYRETFIDKQRPDEPPAASPMAADEEILASARRARNADKFRRLFEDGDWASYPSQSEADAALFSILAFYTQDVEQLLRLMQRSALYRADKESRYVSQDIPFALDQLTDVWTPTARFPRTDAGNAELFAHLHGDKVRYDHAHEKWLLWKGHWWGDDETRAITRLAVETARQRLALAAKVEDREERDNEARFALQSESKMRLDAMLSLARSFPPIADNGKGWDAKPMLLAVENGVIDLTTGALLPGDPVDRITKHVPVAYDKDARAPRWERFVREVFGDDEELVDYIHRYVGYSLTGRVSDQSVVICYGSGSNGKSTFLNTIHSLAGDMGHQMEPEALGYVARLSRGGPSEELANLEGKRIVTAIETNEGVRLNEALVKALSGGESLRARRLHSHEVEFEPTGKFFLATNHKPVIQDDSYGFWRRVRLIPFEQTFEPDDTLGDKLRDEMSGILAWAVRGCLEYQKRGLKPPTVVSEATEEYRSESEVLTEFVADRCVVEATASVAAADLYKAYSLWCEDRHLMDRERLTQQKFGRRMANRFKKKSDWRRTTYYGIGLGPQAVGDYRLALG